MVGQFQVKSDRKDEAGGTAAPLAIVGREQGLVGIDSENEITRLNDKHVGTRDLSIITVQIYNKRVET